MDTKYLADLFGKNWKEDLALHPIMTTDTGFNGNTNSNDRNTKNKDSSGMRLRRVLFKTVWNEFWPIGFIKVGEFKK
jgi:hypothetical protein